jgi:hypothetical protein
VSNTSTLRAKKSVHIPTKGDFFTDGVRLVEVVGKCREGYKVIDATSTVEDETVEVLNAEVIMRGWRHVKPLPVEA